jgi:alkanesulfonate monooxygenase SsuD/methylene tetrahydromethanopterin reductase-like flavin-dependent oxidoreductase (luciferase family)
VNAPVGVALTGHHLRLDSVLRLARRAEALGYDVVLVDGDTGAVPRRPEAPVYEGLTLSGLVLSSTSRTRSGSIRLPFFWNPILLARGLCTLQEASNGRALAFFGVGMGRALASVGVPNRSASRRLAWLDEVLEALRPLLRGEPVTRHGTYVDLDEVRLPAVAEPPPIILAASGQRALELVDAHADVWDANVPPLRDRLEPLREKIHRPTETWIWVFARPDESIEQAARAYRKHCPWFAAVPDSELTQALLWGEPARCRDRLDALRSELCVARPILDLIGLGEAAAARALEALAPAKSRSIS